MNKFKEKIVRFMQGRYGLDQLGRYLLAVSLILMVIFILIWPAKFLYFLALACLIYGYFRILSRNASKRYQENQKFVSFISGQKLKFSQRKTHRIFKCPNCSQKIRVPKGKGKICIKCPKCRIEFIKKT